MAEGKVVVGGGCCCCILIASIIMIACSFDTLEFTEYGLDYNGIQKTIGSETYKGGRYFLGLGHSFLKFPETLQTIEFTGGGVTTGALSSRTSDGLLVTLDISFQYKLKANELQDLYAEFMLDYETVFVRCAKDIITDGASNFTAYQFFQDRTSIGNYFELNLNTFFTEKMHASIEFFQLRDVDLPDSFESAIQQAEVARQSIQKAEYAKQTAQVAANTRVFQAEFTANVTILAANAAANAVMLNNIAEVRAFNITQAMIATAYSELTDKLGMDSTQLMQYIKVKAIEEHASKALTIALDSPFATAA